MNEDSDGHYYAAHVKIQHNPSIPVDAYKEGRYRGFNVSDADTFTAIQTRWSRAHVDTAAWITWLKANGYVVLSYRIEDVILDSRIEDTMGWLQ